MKHRKILWGAVASASALLVAGIGFFVFSDREEEDADSEKHSHLCRDWTEAEYDDLAADIGQHRDDSEDLYLLSLTTAYSAQRCMLNAGDAANHLKPLLQEVLTTNEDAAEVAPDPRWLPEYYEKHLTVDGLFSAWSTIVRKTTASDSDGFDVELRQGLQETISSTLAKALDPDRESHLENSYIERFQDIGKMVVELRTYESSSELSWHQDWELVEVGPVVHGWSVLAPLLRYGDFHEDFLTPVATDIVEFDQEIGGDWAVDGEEFLSFDPVELDATDAMEPVLAALSRNPVAAEQVFDATGDSRVEELLGEVSDDD